MVNQFSLNNRFCSLSDGKVLFYIELVKYVTANLHIEMVRLQAFYLRCLAIQIKPSPFLYSLQFDLNQSNTFSE